MSTSRSTFLCFVMALYLSACSQGEAPTIDSDSGLVFASDNGSISLPKDFKAVVVAEGLGNARHLSVRSNGDLYVKLGSRSFKGSLVALRDENGDGQADQIEYLNVDRGTGIAVHKEYLYYSSNSQVFRRKFNGDELLPSGEEELMLTLPRQGQHGAKPLAFDGEGNMYVTIGAPSNACQDPDRQPGIPGQDPCPLLERYAGIWKFSDDRLNQEFEDGSRYATGIRHAVGITWNQANSTLYAMQHGRDQLHQFWPQLYSAEQSAELPAEEMFEVQEGDDFGWPYCYYDPVRKLKLLNPEYGGDAQTVGRCDQAEDPIMGFPGHWAPNALVFYNASQFPKSYSGGAFVAFHGSWNRAPLPQQGYKVVFVPFENGKPKGDYEDFATEFANQGGVLDSPGEAEFRPCGLALGPDGSLYISDSVTGRIWRVVYSPNS